MFTVLFTSCTAGTRLCPGVRTVDLSSALFAICLGCAPASFSVWLVMCVLASEWWPWVLRGRRRIPLCWRSILVAGLWSCGTTRPHYLYMSTADSQVNVCHHRQHQSSFGAEDVAFSQYKWCLGIYMKYHEVILGLGWVGLPDPRFHIYIYIHICNV